MTPFFAIAILVSATAAPPVLPQTQQILLPVVDDPTISYRVWFKVGSQNDPAGKEGLAAVTASMLAEGSTKQNHYEAILDQLFPLAGSYDASCTLEMTVVYGRIHKDNRVAYQKLLAEAICNPAFLAEDLERVKSRLLDHIESTLRYSSDEELAKAVLYETYFHGTPYGHIVAGRVKSLKSITLDDVKSFYREYYTRDNVVVGLGGGYAADDLTTLSAQLAILPDGKPAMVPPPQPNPLQGIHVTIVEKDAPATAISIGLPLAVLRGQKDWYPLAVANSWFGEHRNSASHLYQVIRELRGLNYGDYSYLEHFANGGMLDFPAPNDARRSQIFEIWLRPVVHTARHFVLRAALRELHKLVDHGMTQEDFESKRHALAHYCLHFAPTTSDRLGYAIDDRFYGIPAAGHLQLYRQRMNDVTLAEANAAIRKYLQYDNLQIVIVTKDAAALRDALIANTPSPVTYPSPRPAAVLEEDKEISTFPLSIKPENVQIVPGKDLFE